MCQCYATGVVVMGDAQERVGLGKGVPRQMLAGRMICRATVSLYRGYEHSCDHAVCIYSARAGRCPLRARFTRSTRATTRAGSRGCASTWTRSRTPPSGAASPTAPGAPQLLRGMAAPLMPDTCVWACANTRAHVMLRHEAASPAGHQACPSSLIAPDCKTAMGSFHATAPMDHAPQACDLFWLKSPKIMWRRYIGSLVGDFHRTLLYGGIYGYPGDDAQPQRQAAPAVRVRADVHDHRAGAPPGPLLPCLQPAFEARSLVCKLRLLYECMLKATTSKRARTAVSFRPVPHSAKCVCNAGAFWWYGHASYLKLTCSILWSQLMGGSAGHDCRAGRTRACCRSSPAQYTYTYTSCI